MADLFSRYATSRADTPWVTARDVALFAKSPFAFWSECHAPPHERDPPSAFNELLKEKGIEHEARVLRERFRDAARATFDTREEGFRLLLDEMARGTRAIAGLPLLHAPRGVRGAVDLLERRDDAPSVFGPWHYVVKEIKLAKNLKDEHRLQAALYHWALGDIQGFTPAAFYLLNRDQEEFPFAFDEPELVAALAAVRAIRSGHVKPDAALGCGAPPWESYTDRCAIERGDVSLVNQVGASMRPKLVSAGFPTVAALARAPEDALLSIQGVGAKKAATFRTHANVLLTGKPQNLEPVRLRAHRTEVFFDLEGTSEVTDDLAPIDYLIGAFVGGSYRSFVATTADELGEGEMWRAFLAWFAGLDDPVLYHWHHYERTHLKRLAARHGIDPALHARLFASLHDLHEDANRCFAFPTYGTSIKVIAPYLGFKWRQGDVNAMESIALYFDYASTGDRAKLQKVLDYNEDDCVATRVVKDWLVANGGEVVHGPITPRTKKRRPKDAKR